MTEMRSKVERNGGDGGRREEGKERKGKSNEGQYLWGIDQLWDPFLTWYEIMVHFSFCPLPPSMPLTLDLHGWRGGRTDRLVQERCSLNVLYCAVLQTQYPHCLPITTLIQRSNQDVTIGCHCDAS
jgi:hypothetical protein